MPIGPRTISDTGAQLNPQSVENDVLSVILLCFLIKVNLLIYIIIPSIVVLERRIRHNFTLMK